MTRPLIALLLLAASGANAQSAIPFRGVLERDGAPVADSDVEMDFAYFDVAEGGTPCSSEQDVSVQLANGEFSVVLLPEDICLTGTLYVEVTVDDGVAPPEAFPTRQRIYSAPTALGGSPERAFVAPQGVTFSEGAELGVVTDATFPGASTRGLLLKGTRNGHVAVQVEPNNVSDSFLVQIAEPTNANGQVNPGIALRVDASGHTTVGEMTATDVEVDTLLADAVTTDAINGDLATFNGAGTAGCIRIGDIQQCWGRYSSTTVGTYLQVEFAQPFLDTSFSFTCTPHGGADSDRRFCQAKACTRAGCAARTASGSGFSGINGHYLAIGPWR